MQTSDQINLAIAVISGLSTVMSLGVLIATFQILRANRQTVEIMKEQVLSTTRPYVQVSPWIRSGSTMLMLTIRNSGASAAQNLKLTIDRDFFFNAEQIESKNLRSYTAFAQTIQSLPPKAELSFHLGLGHVIFSNVERCPRQFTVSANYEFDGCEVTETSTVDLQPFMYSAKPIDPIVEQLEKLNQNIASIRSALQQEK